MAELRQTNRERAVPARTSTRRQGRPATDTGLTPLLFCNETTVAADEAPLACPSAPGEPAAPRHGPLRHPHRRARHPTVGLSIDPDTGPILADDQARALHGAHNCGPMLAIGYWCEEGCRGSIELREHKGNLFAGLHNEQPVRQHDTQ